MILRHHILLQKKTKLHAFTLVELMFAIVILGVVGIGLTSLMIGSAKSMRWSINKSLITNDFRQFTLQASQDALNASHAYLYPSFNTNDCDDPGDRRGLRLSGDCLVLVSTEPSPTINSQRFYRRIVIYNRAADASENDIEGNPVFRREITFLNPTIPTTTPIETVLAAQRSNFEDPETVLELSRGLSENQLFLRAANETFIINGEIIHGQNAQRITNTYNLTISTRG